MSASASADTEFEARFARIEGLLAELSRASDPRLAEATREVLATVLELHRRGLQRVLEIASKEAQIQSELALDERVNALLLLHGLHPVSLAERASRNVAALSERFRSKVERAEVAACEASQIVVRVVPAASACASTRASLQKDWQQALLGALPDAEGISVELSEPAPALVTLRLSREAERSGAAR